MVIFSVGAGLIIGAMWSRSLSKALLWSILAAILINLLSVWFAVHFEVGSVVPSLLSMPMIGWVTLAVHSAAAAASGAVGFGLARVIRGPVEKWKDF